MKGVQWLKKTSSEISALYLPGVSNQEILQGALSICHLHKCPLMISEKDLYDCLTDR